MARASTTSDVFNAIAEGHRRELFEGWPDAHAVESMDLHETDGVTTLTNKMAFRDTAGRDHMAKTDGAEDSFGKMEDLLRSLLDPRGSCLRVAAFRARLHRVILGPGSRGTT